MRKSAPRLPKLTKRAEFQAAAGDGRRFRSSCMTVQVLDRDPDGVAVRLGLTASRKVGHATKRNRIRRRLRAAAHDAFVGEDVPADVVAVARAEAISAPYAELVSALRNALTKARAQRKQHAKPSGPGLRPDALTEPTETDRS